MSSRAFQSEDGGEVFATDESKKIVLCLRVGGGGKSVSDEARLGP